MKNVLKSVEVEMPEFREKPQVDFLGRRKREGKKENMGLIGEMFYERIAL